MPYSGPKDESLPKHVQEMPPAMREMWVKAFNAMHEDCQKEGGEDCEGKAMRGANSVVKQDTEMATGFMFVELQDATLTAGKPFTGFATGKFTDMRGQAIEFPPDKIKTYLKNTLKVIKARQAKGMPGLPIDRRLHDHADAAGWITGAEQSEVEDSDGNIVPALSMSVEWTPVGKKLVGSRTMTNFSPSFNRGTEAVIGGSLTNWPASVDGNGIPLFPAIELSQGVLRVREVQMQDSLSDKVDAIHRAWSQKHEQPAVAYSDVSGWVQEVFEGYVIVFVGDKHYRVNYTTEDDSIVFADRDTWKEVKQEWVEMQIKEGTLIEFTTAETPTADKGIQKAINDIKNIGAADLSTEPPAAGQTPDETGNGEIDMTKEELQEFVRAEMRGELQSALAELLPTKPVDGEGASPRFDILQVLDMAETKEGMVAELKQYMLDQHAAMQQEARREAARQIALVRRESHVAELCHRVVGGTDDHPHGIPINEQDLKEFLCRLPEADLEFAKKLLTAVHEQGLIPFTELGHGRTLRGTAELQSVYGELLDGWVKEGHPVSEFFAVNPELGDMAQYNLSKYQEVNK